MNAISMKQREQRVPVNVDVIVGSALASEPGTITDLTESGAKINGSPHAVGSKVKIDAAGEAVWAKVRWAEADRMGVEFETPIPGQLRALLNMRRPANDQQAPVFGRRRAI